MAHTSQATIGGKFAPLIGLRNEDIDITTMINTYNTAITSAASKIRWNERRGSPDIFMTNVTRGEI